MTDLRTYTDKLKLELELANVSGANIGNILADVEQHCADSGEDPVDAFGPAREYAASIVAEVGTVGKIQWFKITASNLAGWAGVMLTSQTIDAAVAGAPARLDAGFSSLMIIAAVGVLLIVLVFRPLQRRPWLFYGILAGWATLLLTFQWWLEGLGAVTLSAWPLALLGLALVGLSTWMSAHHDNRRGPLTNPRDPAANARLASQFRRASLLGTWLFPLMTAFVVLPSIIKALGHALG